MPYIRRELAHANGPPMSINDVYNGKILEFAGNIPRVGRLENPDATAKAHSKLCGSTVTVDIAMDGDRVSDYAHDVKACALGQSSASILAANVVGQRAQDLKALRQRMHAMLKEGGEAPDGAFADLAYLEPVRDYRARHASTLLAFDALVDAIEQVEGRKEAA